MADARVPLLMGFHCHQPVGNFDSVLRHACRTCYGPLLAHLAAQPAFRFSFHASGSLLEWMEKEEKGIFSTLRELARSGQAELLTSGYYEPILLSIPRADAKGQIALLNEYLSTLSGRRPQGLWLTERIWEASLVPLLAESGVRYALVDDNHFRAAGLSPPALGGYFNTEFAGENLALYPISQRLRYIIPFHPVAEVVAEIASARAKTAAVIFDDGEKFGLWPGTAKWVYEEGWLADFLAAVVESGTVAPMTYSEHFASHPPRGRVFLPPSSYAEMEEWSLPPAEAESYRELMSHLAREGRGEQARRFLRGGTWPDFLLRYPESDNLHKKMLSLSRRLGDRDLPRVRLLLYQGQCNDAYWHGMFGGLYLPVLRDGVTRALNEAERELDAALGMPLPLLADLNGDGYPEAQLRNAEAVATVSSARGGQLYELSDKKSLFNLLGTLARRPELYHKAAEGGREGGGVPEGGVTTIHEAARSLSGEMRAHISYDWYPRYAFIDHFLPPGTPVADFARCAHTEWGDFVNQPYRLSLAGGKAAAERDGGVHVPGHSPFPFRVEKDYHLKARELAVRYRLAGRAQEAFTAVFCVEVNLYLPSGTGARAALDGKSFPLAEVSDLGVGKRVEVYDPVLAGVLAFSAAPRGRVWAFPVHTVSQSEKGFDLTFQGISFSFQWEERFPPGETRDYGLTLGF